MIQNDLKLRHPRIVEKNREHHQPLDLVQKSRSRCEIVFAPPAEADIATAILTNVIEHLVLLFPPNKRVFTAKAAWADFLGKPVAAGDATFGGAVNVVSHELRRQHWW